jgi:hypothetical protein
MGSISNLQLLWETGEIGWEPLHEDKTGVYTDLVTVAIYAEKPRHSGWKLDSRNEPRPRNDLSC